MSQYVTAMMMVKDEFAEEQPMAEQKMGRKC